MTGAVLITRPAPDAGLFAEKCREAGLFPVLAPMIDIKFPATSVNVGDAVALAFTSANGVRAFAKASADRQLPVFAVGRATAECAIGAGFNKVSVADGDVESLADCIIQATPQGEILHIAGDNRAGDLVRLLERASVRARCNVLYEARAASSLGEDGKKFLSSDASGFICFFSPRTARIFMRLVANEGLQASLAHHTSVCLSEPIAAHIAGEGWARVVVAKRREANAMIELMAAAAAG